MILLHCENKRDIDCGYNGKTIKVINDQDVTVNNIGDLFFLYFEEGIKIDSPNLLDTIYLLLPCNLPDQFKIDNQNVTVSGEIEDNPDYSSHNNYTDFYINEISKY